MNGFILLLDPQSLYSSHRFHKCKPSLITKNSVKFSVSFICRTEDHTGNNCLCNHILMLHSARLLYVYFPVKFSSYILETAREGKKQVKTQVAAPERRTAR